MANESNNIFAPINYSWNEYKAPSLDSFGEAIKIRDDRHFKALEGKAAIAKQFRELGLVDDPEYVDAKSTEYMNRIDSNIQEGGYAGDALTEIYNIGKEMQSDPVLWGKVANQNAVNKFFEDVDKNPNITPKAKDMLHAVDHYTGFIKKVGETDEQAIRNRELERQYAEYEKRVADAVEYDKTHETVTIIPPMERPTSLDAKEIGVVKWKPQITPQEWANMDTEWVKVISTLGHKFGQDVKTPYIKSKGQFVPFDGDMSKSDDHLFYYSKKGGGFEKLEEEKIREALYDYMGVDGRIPVNQKLRDQFDFYTITETWANTGSNDRTVYTNAYGMPNLNTNDVLKKAIDNFAKGHAFTKYNQASWDSEVGMTAMTRTGNGNKTGKSGKGGVSDIHYTSVLTGGMPFGNIVTSATTLHGYQQNLLNYKKTLIDIIGDGRGVYKDSKGNEITLDYDNFEKYVREILESSKYNNEYKFEIQNIYDDYLMEQRRYNNAFTNITKNKDAEEVDKAMQFVTMLNDLDSFENDMPSNEFVSQYRRQCKELFGGHEKIGVEVDEHGVDNFKQMFQNTYGSSQIPEGITIDCIGNRTFISLDRDHCGNLYYFSKAIDDILNTGNIIEQKVHNYLQGGNTINGIVTKEKKLYPTIHQKLPESMERSVLYRYIDGDVITNKDEQIDTNRFNNFVNDIENIPKKAQSVLEKNYTDANQKAVVQGRTSIPYRTIYEYLAKNEGWNKEQVDDLVNRAYDALFTADMSKFDMFIGNGNTLLPQNITSKNQIMSMVRSIRTQDPKRITVGTDPDTGAAMITISADPNSKSSNYINPIDYVNEEDPIVKDIVKQSDGTLKDDSSAGYNDNIKIIIPDWVPDEYIKTLYNSGSKLALRQIYQDGVNGGYTPLYEDSWGIKMVDNNTYIHSPKDGNFSIEQDFQVFNKEAAASYIAYDKELHKLKNAKKYGLADENYINNSLAKIRLYLATAFNVKDENDNYLIDPEKYVYLPAGHGLVVEYENALNKLGLTDNIFDYEWNE